MLLRVVTVGKPKDKLLGARSAEFLARCGAYGKVELTELPDSDVVREGKALLREIDRDRGAFVFVLSEEGRALSTAGFAAKLAGLNCKALFLIGGPFGLATEVKARADLLWSLSPLTFTHELARLLLCEQLYRALNFNAGGSYHHQ